LEYLHGKMSSHFFKKVLADTLKIAGVGWKSYAREKMET